MSARENSNEPRREPPEAPNARPRNIVLQIVPSLDAGGAERTTIDIARALNEAGWAALVASEGGRLEPELARAGGRLIRLPAASKNPAVIFANAARLAKLIRRERVGVIHARSRAPAWSALIAARQTGIPFVTTYHGAYEAQNPFKRFYNSVMARGDAVIANSRWTAQHIAGAYGWAKGRIVTIPRGIDLSVFDPAAVAPERVRVLREAWGAGADDRVILLPGRLTRWKGQHVFIEALAILAREAEIAGVRAVIAGDAQGRLDYFAELKAAIARHRLAGTVVLSDHIADMPAAYAASDIVVSASIEPEAFGRIPAEAAAMRRPVIATAHGGALETVIDGRSGLLAEPGSAASLASALSEMLRKSPDERDAMGDAGHAHAAERYSVARMCADTLAVYRKLLRIA
jgi:glycosyltransferase involved in cell wall biosynthesis